MTVKLELNPEIEAGLITQAQARGLSFEDYLAQVLQTAADGNVVKRASESLLRKAEAVEHTRNPGARDNTHVQRERPGRKSLARLFAESPLKGLNLAFEREPDTGRPVKL